MTEILTPTTVQIVGAVIVAAVLLQVAAMIVSTFRRLGYESEQRRMALEILNQRAATTLAQSHEERDRVELSWNGFRKFEIARKEYETKDVCSFYLKPHDGRSLPPFLPGQYLTFQLRLPDEPKAIIRCYSLSDSPAVGDYYRVSIKRVPPPRDKPDLPPGRSSNFFHDSIEVGGILDVKAPSGHFYLNMNKTSPVVLIGGGIGLTPVVSMLNTICASDVQREVWFFLGVRDRTEHAMKDHLDNLNSQFDNLHLHVCYSDPTDDDLEGRDYTHAERVSVELMKRLLPSNNYEFYICGPPPMMEAVTSDLKDWGVPESDINFEAFGPASVKKTAKVDALASAPDQPAIELVFDRSGKTLTWDPAAESLLDFAEDNGITMDSGCRAGNCGNCITAIKSGDVTYFNESGSAPEDGSCLTCISVPKTNLTLDA